MNDQLPRLLAARLTGPLPGPMAGSRFEARPRYWRHYDSAPTHARAAAVLVLLYPHRHRWHLPLTLRPPHLADHAGQVSFPGGGVEPGERSDQAAIREFHEELGAEGQTIELLGRLSPLYVHASNYRITPWVGATDTRPKLTPNPTEVAAVLEVPLSHVLDGVNFRSHQRRYRGRPYTAPHFAWRSYRIWGATCMILGELITVLEGLKIED